MSRSRARPLIERPPATWRHPSPAWCPTGKTLLRVRRRYLRLTQRELAAAWRVPRTVISHWERAPGRPILGKVRPLLVATCAHFAAMYYGPPEAAAAPFRPRDLDLSDVRHLLAEEALGAVEGQDLAEVPALEADDPQGELRQD